MGDLDWEHFSETGQARVKPGLLKRVASKVKKGIKGRKAEKARRKDIYRQAYRQMEPKYIRKKAKRDLSLKYAPKKRGGYSLASSWSLPKPGQRSVGQNLFDAMEGKPIRKKR